MIFYTHSAAWFKREITLSIICPQSWQPFQHVVWLWPVTCFRCPWNGGSHPHQVTTGWLSRKRVCGYEWCEGSSPEGGLQHQQESVRAGRRAGGAGRTQISRPLQEHSPHPSPPGFHWWRCQTVGAVMCLPSSSLHHRVSTVSRVRNSCSPGSEGSNQEKTAILRWESGVLQCSPKICLHQCRT